MEFEIIVNDTKCKRICLGDYFLKNNGDLRQLIKYNDKYFALNPSNGLAYQFDKSYTDIEAFMKDCYEDYQVLEQVDKATFKIKETW